MLHRMVMSCCTVHVCSLQAHIDYHLQVYLGCMNEGTFRQNTLQGKFGLLQLMSHPRFATSVRDSPTSHVQDWAWGLKWGLVAPWS